MVMPAIIEVGSHVWVPDPDFAWIDGIVFNISVDEVEVQTSDGSMVVAHLSKVHPKDVEAPAGGVDDMTKLQYLHEPAVLHNLATRFEINEIYTYCGSILIAINPFQSLSHLYDTYMMEQYKGVPFGELSPHVFSVADVAYREMINEGKNISILVSGESGAGKTETTKMLMHYLAYLGGHSHTAAEGRTVEQKVLESNPVLEAFGNAKTVRNNNSSRFGKFVEIQFNKGGRISGAAIRTYLLERSRVCQISDSERNYHCFYLLCAAPQEEVEKYKLGDPKSFHYLNQSDFYELDGVSDSHYYLTTRKAMDIVGINEREQDAIFRVVAAILHLGNITFAKDEDIDSAIVKDEQSEFHLQMTAELLRCDPRLLEDALCKRVMVTPEDVIKKSLDPLAAAVSRDGLAKTIYSRLFDWLVDKINDSIGQDVESKCLIGVLDIYGFESFITNSFEQFCINFTNEKLQQHFNQHVFKKEQEEYVKEEINWNYVEFVDNQDVLDLIEKKPGGVISLLDEACMFPKATHETFAQKLYQTFKDHKRFIKPKLTRSDFTIVHYAGEVQYQSDQFLDKNKDYVVPEHQDLLCSSKCSFVAGLFPPLLEETTKSSKFSSVGSRFKLQLQQLMDILNSREPHYIRCVKPNNLLKPSVFENENIIRQLHSGGVLEAIRIKCAGYPAHKTFSEFLHRYRILAPEVLKGSYEEKVACKWILEKMEMTGYMMGETKVFLKAAQTAKLDAKRARELRNAAKDIQRHSRRYTARKKYIVMRKASIHIQSHWRGKLACNSYKYIKRQTAAVKIQKNLRRQLVRRNFNRIKCCALVLQTGLRAMDARDKCRFRGRMKAATVIQANWRCHKDVSCYNQLKKASVDSNAAEGKPTKLKIPGGSTASVEEEKSEVVKQLAELACCLQSERQLRINLEEAKEQEIRLLQHSLQTLQNKFDETNALLLKEHESPSKANGMDCTVIETSAHHRGAEEIENLHAEVEILKINLEEAKEQEIRLLQHSLQTLQNKFDETNALLLKEHESPSKANGMDCTVIETSAHHRGAEEIENLHAEVEILKALLQEEKQRADNFERKYAEVQELSEERLKKLEETKRRVYQLQGSLNRMLYSMSDQFAELKTILHLSSNSASTSIAVAGNEQADEPSDNSDASSSDSDFTFPAPANFSSTNPNTFPLVVSDLSSDENSGGSERWKSDKEGEFEDYF